MAFAVSQIESHGAGETPENVETRAVLVLALGVLTVAAVGVAFWVGVAVTTGETVLDFLTRLCGVADAAGPGGC
jgi:hypothetical protein